MMDKDNNGKGDRKTEVLRLIQVARPCLRLVEVGSFLESRLSEPQTWIFNLGRNVKDT